MDNKVTNRNQGSWSSRAVIRIAAGVVVGIFLSACGRPSYEAGLLKLDNSIAEAQQYVRTREDYIKVAELEIQSATSDEQLYGIYDKIFALTYDYQFDKALAALEKRELYASSKDEIIETGLLKAMLYCSSGYFLECSDLLSSIDSTTFTSDDQLYLYYHIRYRFCKDFREYIRPGKGDELEKKAGWYRGQLIEHLPERNHIRGMLLIQELIEKKNFSGAEEVGVALLGQISPESHDYAIASYYMGDLYTAMGDEGKAVHYYTESAICDVRNATMDNASLQCIAIALFDSDINRSFRYTQKALDDALFYNSRLRPMQIARRLPEIESRYESLTNHDLRIRTVLLIILSILAAGLSVLFVQRQSYQRKLRYTISQLTEANAAKEEFLALFLAMSSSYLDKLKHFLGRSQMESELRDFYTAFDSAFIKLYPTFVEDFNALLVPSARIVLKKGETLNTQLRIYALMRLGIDQPAQIARLLRYSPTTIYNYRSQTKSDALNGKEDFENMVLKIGS